MNDASFWLAGLMAGGGVVVGALARGWTAGRSVVVRTDCVAIHALVPSRVEVAKLIEEETSKTRHTLRNELTPVIGELGKRIHALETTTAVAAKEHEGEQRKLESMDGKLDRLLDVLPDHSARLAALERRQLGGEG